MKTALKIILIIIFLPLILLKDAVRSKRVIWKKILYVLVILIGFGFYWLGGLESVKNLLTSNLYESGITDKLSTVHIQGTSMLPTIQDGSTVSLSSPKKYGLERGDIVSFQNKETAGLFYLKRIVGLPAETVSIKNGHVIINGKIMDEKYTLNDLPTFGSTFITDCEVYTVPQNHFLVLGDNRTVSEDSRILGFVDKEEIEGVIKTHLQAQFASEARQKDILKKEVKPLEFLDSLNDFRRANKNSLLVTHSLLNTLALKRAEQIRDNFDSWKKNTIPAEKLLEQSGYRFNLIHEYVSFGYLDAKSLLEQIQEQRLEKETFLSTKYTEVGIGVTERKFKECTYPVISIILSWPSIPTYDQGVINSWQKEITATNKILSDLQSWVGVTTMDQGKLRNAITSVAQENEIATRIYKKMTNREWLTQKDVDDIKLYDQLIKEVNALLNDLFGAKVKGVTTPIEPIRRI